MYVTTIPETAESDDSSQQKSEPRCTSQPVVLVKYGGNAMVEPELVASTLAAIARLHAADVQLVLVHGGGPYIQALLTEVGLESEFIGGHRRTDERTIRYISMALCGQVNGELVSRLNALGAKAVGISGRDAGLVKVVRRCHTEPAETGEPVEHDLGFVGDVSEVDTRLVHDLLAGGYLPVVAPISSGTDGHDYNVNADMFAGHLAAALEVDSYLVLTDVDGLRRIKDDPASLLSELSLAEVGELIGTSITGGMIPKVESCRIALEGGVPEARIINGMDPRQLSASIVGEQCGTVIRSDA
jgi:acetylglutamate kinase